MKESLSKKETPMIIGAGVIIGIIAVALVYFGNPANMGFCIACFLRDTTGALGFHSAAAVQYIRPEIVGLVLGSCILALGNQRIQAKRRLCTCHPFCHWNVRYDRMPDVPWLSVPYDPSSCRR